MKPENFDEYQKVLLNTLLEFYKKNKNNVTNSKNSLTLEDLFCSEDYSGFYSESALAQYFRREELVEGPFQNKEIRNLVTPLVVENKFVLRVLSTHPTDKRLSFIYSINPNQIDNIRRYLSE